jgi:hypothetical protein
MKCKKCNNEVDDKLLICPKCGNILKKEETGYHHNYATKSMELGAAKLTEVEYDPSISEDSRPNALVLFKNIIFVLVNILALGVYSTLVYFLLFKYNNDIEINDLFIIEVSTIIPITILSFISYELLFYKAHKNPFLGFIPIYRYKVLLTICNDEQIDFELKKILGIFIAYILYYGASLSSFYSIAYIDYWIVFSIITLVSSFILIKMRIKFLGDLSERFNANKNERVLTIIFPFIMIILFALSKREYISLSDSYL